MDIKKKTFIDIEKSCDNGSIQVLHISLVGWAMRNGVTIEVISFLPRKIFLILHSNTSSLVAFF